jgi:hypothetical protein
MQNTSAKNYRLIRAFTNELLDKRTNAYKSLRAASNLCRQSIEKLLTENIALKKIINTDDNEDAWIKELIINYTLLKMQHHAILWEIDEHELAIKNKEPKRKRATF